MLQKILRLSLLNSLKNKSFQNFIFLSSIQVSNILINLVSMPILITSIGVDQFGLVNLSLSIIVISNIFVSFGFNLSGPRETAINQKSKKELSILLSRITVSKLLLATVVAILLTMGIFIFNIFQEYQSILVFSLLILYSEATFSLWFFQGLEKLKLISIANVFSKLLYLLGIVLFIDQPNHSKFVNFLLGASGLTINVLVIFYIKFKMKIALIFPQIKEIYNSLKSNINFFLSNLTSYISINGGLIMLSFYSTPETLGNYSLSEKITMIIRLFPAILTQSIYPNVVKLFHNNLDGFFKFARKAYFLGLSISLIISIFIYSTAPFIIKLLSKNDIQESIFYLKILSFIPFLASLNLLNVLILLIKNEQELFFKISSIACFCMLSLGGFLASNYGAIGICIALLATELIYFFLFSLVLVKNSREVFYRIYFNKNIMTKNV
ncbi:oligosaccharide flippase family protein [Belliella pelovolcani]|uniref:Polysaccharide transporter, PST family n=1 Tax=Belliella pelovolcani TaxID=529505 RepID=A0A1N7KH64_9BACT|nr:oligosaccharide flippase family protein [Belliella pelovolcani]SIS60938.1 polysaccharide transporter, PST family [Belliella pelovolcani]